MEGFQGLLDKIHQKAYWRVLIRPERDDFDAKRIPSISRCKEVVESSRVILRGWDYPHVDSERFEVGEDWLGGSCDWDAGHHYEYWRLYQSSQFIHQFSCTEEYHSLSWRPAPDRYLSILNTLFSITEIFEFGARLSRQVRLGGSIDVAIELHGMADRTLVFADMSRFLRPGKYVSRTDVVSHSVTLSAISLSGDPAEAALDAATSVFERFHWFSPPRDVLREEQLKLLERRLGV